MYKIKAAMMAKDPDLFVNMVNSDLNHIERAKAKAERHQTQKEIDLNTMLCSVFNKEVRKATANVMKCERPKASRLKTMALSTGLVGAGWLCSLMALM